MLIGYARVSTQEQDLALPSTPSVLVCFTLRAQPSFRFFR